jgi:hypothetical protein
MPKKARTPAATVAKSTSSVSDDGAMGAQAARELTEQIKHAVVHLWELLLEAHERQVWEALGYSSWAQYVEAEFDFGRQHSYRLLKQGRVIRVLREAMAEVSPDGDTEVHLTEGATRAIQPVLEEVVLDTREAVEAGIDPQRAIDEVVRQHRQSAIGSDWLREDLWE